MRTSCHSLSPAKSRPCSADHDFPVSSGNVAYYLPLWMWNNAHSNQYSRTAFPRVIPSSVFESSCSTYQGAEYYRLPQCRDLSSHNLHNPQRRNHWWLRLFWPIITPSHLHRFPNRNILSLLSSLRLIHALHSSLLFRKIPSSMCNKSEFRLLKCTDRLPPCIDHSAVHFLLHKAVLSL